jgi:hypothetical protein
MIKKSSGRRNKKTKRVENRDAQNKILTSALDNTVKSSRMKKIEAARELHAIYNSYEIRKVKLATILRKMYKWGDNWRLCGYAHDYTV